MLILAFFQWWYGTGWRDNVGRTRKHVINTYHGWSVPLLVQTLGAPWRRLGGNGGRSLSQRFRSFIDSAVSRLIGLAVRTLVLVAAFLVMGLQALFGAVMLVVWPLLPPAIIGCAAWGLM